MNSKVITLNITVCRREELSEVDRELVEKAEEMTNNAYAPYSHFLVGAAIRLSNGEIVTGSNQENAAFPSGTCAERSACFYAGANFPKEKFETIAVAAREEGKELRVEPASPCGACRQSLLEYEALAGKDVRVMLVGKEKIYVLPSVKSLLPLAFTVF